MNDMLCLYIGGKNRLIRKIEGPLWTNIYKEKGRILDGGWYKTERYHWIGPLFLGVWNDRD
jgi:hypothetical protein